MWELRARKQQRIAAVVRAYRNFFREVVHALVSSACDSCAQRFAALWMWFFRSSAIDGGKFRRRLKSACRDARWWRLARDEAAG